MVNRLVGTRKIYFGVKLLSAGHCLLLFLILELNIVPAVFAATTSTSCVTTRVGNPQGDPPQLPPECSAGSSGGGPAGPCQQAPAPPGDIRGAIINKWGIILNLPYSQLQLAWQEFHEIDCTGFLQAIRGAVVESWGYGYAQQFSCPQDGEVDVRFSNQWEGEFMKAILVHELTHVWQFCSANGEQNRLMIPAAYGAEGGLTNYSRSGCGFSVDLYNEDHADTIALYLNPDQGELTCGYGAPNPFSGGRYLRHRDIAESGVGKQR